MTGVQTCALPISILSYSKGAQGLFVYLQEGGIFTPTVFSPSYSLRQFPSRYAIRARLNLPDKEFRYLRTVIVTADIHQGLYQSASCLATITADI